MSQLLLPPFQIRQPLISDQVSKAQVEVVLEYLQHCLNKSVAGAVVEFGCYIGTTSLFIRRALDAAADTSQDVATIMTPPDREFHVYDSFEGLPPKQLPDESPAGTQFQAGELAVTKKQFLKEFQKANLRPPVIHKNWFSDLSDSDVPASIAFAFLDGDFYESIRDSLQLVLPRMSAGGRIIIDDYAREALPGVANAVKVVAPQLVSRIKVAHNLGIIEL